MPYKIKDEDISVAEITVDLQPESAVLDDDNSNISHNFKPSTFTQFTIDDCDYSIELEVDHELTKDEYQDIESFCRLVILTAMALHSRSRDLEKKEGHRTVIVIKYMQGKIGATFNKVGQVVISVLSGGLSIIGGASLIGGSGLRFFGKMPLSQLFNGMGQGADAIGKGTGQFGGILEGQANKERNYWQIELDLAKRNQQDGDQQHQQKQSDRSKVEDAAVKAVEAKNRTMETIIR